MDWDCGGEAGCGWNDRRRDIAAPERCLPGPTTTDTHGVAPLPSLAARSCSSGSWAKFVFNETNDSCSCRRRARRQAIPQERPSCTNDDRSAEAPGVTRTTLDAIAPGGGTGGPECGVERGTNATRHGGAARSCARDALR